MTAVPAIEVGVEVPVQTRAPDAVDLFSFSAAAWLLHRIHYDLPFTTEHDGHPGLLIHGPLQGTYMIQAVQWWLGPAARLKSIEYRHSLPAYLGDGLTVGGVVTGVDSTAGTFDVDLWVKKADDITTSGRATFALPQQNTGAQA